MSGNQLDAIVIGAGHNGLTAATTLARGGMRTLVLERMPEIGGLAGETEFHPGYRSAGVLQDSRLVRPALIGALRLEQHGLKLRDEPPAVLALSGDGESLWLPGSPRLANGTVDGVSPRDAERYLELSRLLNRFSGILGDWLDREPPDIGSPEDTPLTEWARRGLALRRLGRDGMLELMRIAPMCVADWLEERFESDLLQAALALPAISSTFTGPRSPGSNFTLLRLECGAGPGIEGDGPALVAALESAAREAGVQVRTRAEVQGLLVDRGAVRGVVLDGGDEIAANVVAASCSPQRTLLDLLPRDALDHDFAHRVRCYRARGTTARVSLALDRAPRFRADPDGSPEHLRIGESLNGLERAFDAVKYRELPERPALEVNVPTVSRPGLAPPGHAVLSALVHFVPQAPEPGWNDAQRDRLASSVLSILDDAAPDLTSSIVATEVLTPPDLEARYGLSGGQLHHGEHALDQLLSRPLAGCARYATPIRGLFLCGSGSHPGGGLSGLPGWLGARAILGQRPG